MRLAHFQQLHTLVIWGLSVVDGGVQLGGALLSDLSHVLPPLLHCRALRELRLWGELDLRAEHAAVIARIPSLEAFSGSDLRIESLLRRPRLRSSFLDSALESTAGRSTFVR